MKKLIILSSLTLSVGFAIALANAEDVTMMNKEVSKETSSLQDSSKVPSTQQGSSASRDMTSQSMRSSTEMSKTMSSCTDDAGMTFKKGQTGFRDCMKSMKKHKSSGGQAGVMGKDTPTDMNSSSSTTESTRDSYLGNS